MAENDRRAVTGDLDHILGRVRPGRREERRDHFIDSVTFGVEQFGKLRLPGLPGSPSTEDGAGDTSDVGTGEAYHSQSSAAGRRGNGNYGIVQDQGRRAERAFGPRPPPRRPRS